MGRVSAVLVAGKKVLELDLAQTSHDGRVHSCL